MLALLAIASGCAKREPPSGGPPDLEPPRLVATYPDSGAAGVPLDATLTVSFSEGMEPRSAADAVALAPRVEMRRWKWEGNTVRVTLADSLRQGQTYTMFVSPSARDRHGNTMATGATVAFSTAAEFPAGRIVGQVEVRGLNQSAVSLWCYRAGSEPDSTAQDFDAIGLPTTDGNFRIEGLTVPGSYRLWAFADLNSNRSFEPLSDVLVPVDTTFHLTVEAPAVFDVEVTAINPRAPGEVEGAVLDSLADSLGVRRVSARSEADSTRTITADTEPGGAFSFQLEPGGWILVGFRDRNGDRAWQRGRELSSEPQRVVIEPAAEIKGLRLYVRGESSQGP